MAQDIAQDMAEDMLGATKAKDGSARVLIVVPPPAVPLGDT